MTKEIWRENWLYSINELTDLKKQEILKKETEDFINLEKILCK